MAHEYVAGEIGGLASDVRDALHLLAERKHGGSVLGEVEVGPADAARLHLDEHLTEPRLRLVDVVAHDDCAVP